MEFIKVSSSNIKAIAWEKNRLFIDYGSGIYEYLKVDKQLYEGLLKADSKGRFVAENIKGKYVYKKLFAKEER